VMSDVPAPIGGVTGAAALRREAGAQGGGGGWMNRANVRCSAARVRRRLYMRAG
jgi:hypothetical protein